MIWKDWVKTTLDTTKKSGVAINLVWLIYVWPRKLEPGFVVTDEPGIYFIPTLIDQWKAEKKFTQFINYNEVTKYRDFGGVRIEDDVLITDTGCRVLGKPIPKTINEIEDIFNQKHLNQTIFFGSTH